MRALYRGSKLYQRSSSGVRSPGTSSLIVPRTGHTPGNQLELKCFDIFCWVFGGSAIWYYVSRHPDMDSLGEELILGNGIVMSHIDNWKKKVDMCRNWWTGWGITATREVRDEKRHS